MSAAVLLPPPSAEKPDFSYASLIAQSLVDAPMQRRTLNGIYEWIQERFPYYRTRQNWQNSIRHNLSLNKGFMKIKRDEAHPGKGSFWTFTPGYESCLNEGHFKPIRSRSGRAALAAAAAMAASKAATAAAGTPDAEPKSPAGPAAAERKPARKSEKRTVRAIRSAKSLKRSHSVPPRDNSAPPPQSTADGATVAMADVPVPVSLAHCDTAPVGVLPGRNSCKKMRVSSSQNHHANAAPVSSMVLGGVPVMSYPQTPMFAPSPGLMNASPMSMSVVTSAMHTPLNQPAAFQFHMPSPCSMPMPVSAMDLASAPAGAGGPYGFGGAHMGPSAVSMVDGASAGVDGVGLFSDVHNGSGDPLCATRRAHMQPRISWHGTDSMHHALATLQHQQQHHQHQPRALSNSLGVTMPGEPVDMGLGMLGDAGAAMCMGAEHAVGALPVDWAMLANMPAHSAMPVDMSVHTPHLHHVSSISSIDAHSIHGGLHDQHHAGDASGVNGGLPASEAAASGGTQNSGFMAFYDEMLRDPSSLMTVFGQDLAAWQCPPKTNTIDPAALCAVDPESSAL
ncbi:hypothetical protein H4R19_002650 [Coemansia spiralis]|nr:hypothetical protein H4R19_002650 [Coemansia spiralis]